MKDHQIFDRSSEYDVKNFPNVFEACDIYVITNTSTFPVKKKTHMTGYWKDVFL